MRIVRHIKIQSEPPPKKKFLLNLLFIGYNIGYNNIIILIGM